MSRRGGKRRQVLQLGDSSSSSKLYRFGYSKGFHREGQGLGGPPNLVGDYSDSDSEDKEDQSTTTSQNHEAVEQAVESQTVPEESQTHLNDDQGDNQSHMDDELRNFLSEIEAIPMPDESKVTEAVSNGPSPTPSNPHEESNGIIHDIAPAEVPSTKKKIGAYSMFVKGAVEFSHSPSHSETSESQEPFKDTKDKETLEEDQLDLEEPTTQWQMVQDETTQYYYYWNWQTNEVTWEIPSGYTQYLLLHKEYQERVAKLTPQQQLALKEKKERKDTINEISAKDKVAVSEQGSKGQLKSHSDSKDASSDFIPGGEDRSHSLHKRKKAKKHKRRYDKSEDENLEEPSKSSETESKSLKKSKANKMIGPQALSIVPYLSDNEEEEDEEEEKSNVKPEDNLLTKTESELSPKPKLEVDEVSLVESALPKDVDYSEDLEDILQETSSVYGPYPCKEEEPGSPDSEQDDEASRKDVAGDVPTEDEIKCETVCSEEKDVEIGIIKELSTETVDNDQQSEGNDHSKDSLKKSIKKESVNMFADDSPPRSNEAKIETVKIETLPKPEIEEGEISDSSESFSRLLAPAEHKKKNKREKDLQKKSLVHASNKDNELYPTENQPLFKGIVGYSEEDDDEEEEEEGELREDSVKSKKGIHFTEKETTERNLEANERLLPRKYKKKKEMESKVKGKSQSCEREPENNVLTCALDSKSDHLPDSCNALQASPDSAVPDDKRSTNEEEKDELDDTEDIDFDDIDNIDRVLEMALEKKREQKSDKSDVKKSQNETAETLSSPPADVKVSETEKSESKAPQENAVADEKDLEGLADCVKDSVKLAFNKLKFLDISTKNIAKLQILLIEMQARYKDWQAGGLSTAYFYEQLQSSEALLSQYEENAVPTGWLCQWDRASCRYFYINQHSNHTQWEYPEAEETRQKTEEKDRSHKKRTKEKEDKSESVKSRGSSASHSSRHRSKKDKDKDRGKRDRHSNSSTHHHRKKKRRRRDHSSSSSSSEEEASQSRHRHRSKRKKRGRSDKSPSLEVLGETNGAEHATVIDDSPRSSHSMDREEPSSLGATAVHNLLGGDEDTRSDFPGDQEASQDSLPLTGLVANYGSEQEGDREDRIEEDGEDKNKNEMDQNAGLDNSEPVVGETNAELNEDKDIDGEEMEEEEETKEEEDDMSGAVIVKPPQINYPLPYVAAMNEPQLYCAPPVYASCAVSAGPTSSTVPAALDGQEMEHVGDTTATTATTEEADKGAKKKKKDKSSKEKSLTANSSIMMKKKRVSSMVQKWQQVKKEVEKENRAKELRQAAIREKINQLKQ